jgi:AraC-like DNA-binding protein
MGFDQCEGTFFRQGKDWIRYQVCRDEAFTLVALESYQSATDNIDYTRQEDFIKVSFWLSGKHTTILDGFGEYEHDRPEVVVTASPWDAIKVDVLNRDVQTACVALCLLPEFFTSKLSLVQEQLPEPLRSLVAPGEKPFGFHRFALTTDLAAATRAVLAAPFSVRRQPVYAEAKAVELMCLLINQMASGTQGLDARTSACGRHAAQLYHAREVVTERYAENITLERLSKEVGLNRMALTSGFRQLFGLSVHDLLTKIRMERAYELLQNEALSITQVADVVGYDHSCNFSTAFQTYFGCSPQKVRPSRR